jgi:hypothetical protein
MQQKAVNGCYNVTTLLIFPIAWQTVVDQLCRLPAG